jgi:hypothetical protein
MVLKSILEKEDPGVVELPRVVQDLQENDVNEWEAVYQLSDDCVVFLEAKLQMSKVSIFFHQYRILLMSIRITLTISSKEC